MHLIEEPTAQTALDEASLKWDQAYQAWECATWAVLHDHTLGWAVTTSGKTRSFTFDGARSLDMPTVTILYEIRGDEIVIHDALFEEAKYGQAGRA